MFSGSCHCDDLLIEDDDVLEFRNLPLSGWITSSLFAISSAVLGALTLFYEADDAWFVSMILWVFTAIMVIRIKYETYTFDKTTGTVSISSRGILGLKERVYRINEIVDVELQQTKDIQGGDDVQLYLKLTGGHHVKLYAGQICGIHGKTKSQMRKRIIKFLGSEFLGNSSVLSEDSSDSDVIPRMRQKSVLSDSEGLNTPLSSSKSKSQDTDLVDIDDESESILIEKN
eukprot:TRINITY_DN6463_c0_g1_i1.p1 TRINITY_DN6463_c0_g1~~TRINITY_DN6463_c0_g1_i1.p1  ORF type:complete len:229 (+),score=42.93 TRINITY_DN6463_c0_g1_i1:135-821(+)